MIRRSVLGNFKANIAFWISLLAGCSQNPIAIISPRPAFVAEPKIALAPNPATPLAGLLTLATDIETTVVLDVASENKQWRIAFDRYGTQHSLPVLGLRPGQAHSIKVHVFNRAGRQKTFEHVLVVNTAPLPAGFPRISTKSAPSKMEPGATLFNVIPHGSNEKFGALLVAVDEVGEVIWYHIGPRFDDVRQLKSGNLLALQGNKIIELDMLGNRLREWTALGEKSKSTLPRAVATRAFHHDVFPLENGNLLALGLELRTLENYPSSETDAAAPTERANVVGDLVVELADDGTIVKQWSLLDMLDPYRIGFGSLGDRWDKQFGARTRDWSHGNAVFHDPRDDSILVSLRSQDATVKFSRQTGELVWIFAPHENWDMNKFGKYLLKPASNQDHFFSYHQHSSKVIANGNVMIYDNGSHRASPFSKSDLPPYAFSRAAEYAIDEKNMKAELVWEYGQFAPEIFYSGALGDADFLPKTGNVLITHGSLLSEKGKKSARIIEVTHTTPAVEVLHIVVSDDTPDAENGWRVYRSDRIPGLYLDLAAD